jgi:hypothetical protein
MAAPPGTVKNGDGPDATDYVQPGFVAVWPSHHGPGVVRERLDPAEFGTLPIARPSEHRDQICISLPKARSDAADDVSEERRGEEVRAHEKDHNLCLIEAEPEFAFAKRPRNDVPRTPNDHQPLTFKDSEMAHQLAPQVFVDFGAE